MGEQPGMSAVGKSTVLVALSKRGHAVADADEDGVIEETKIEGQRDPEPLLREGKVSDLLDSHPADCHLFFAATAANQGAFYGRFDAVVLLTAPLNVMMDRLATRTTNRFGKSEYERERIARDTATVEPLLRQGATHEIDTRQPLTDVVDRLERLAATHAY